MSETLTLPINPACQFRMYQPYISPFDPCPPICVKTYNTGPQLFIPFQPMNLPQFSPCEALRAGTLWPALYAPYPGPPVN